MSAQSELLKDAHETSIKSLVEQLRVIYRVKQSATGDGSGAGAAGPPPAGSAGSDLSAAGDLIFDLARLHLNTYNQLLDMSSRHTDRFINGLRALLIGKRDAPAPCVGSVLEISGALGTWVAHSFIVLNRSSVKAEVTFAMSEFQQIGGDKPFTAQVRFAADPPAPPADRCLAPGESRAFTLEVNLDPTCFAARQRYAATLDVRTAGRANEELPVRLDVQ